MSEIIRRVRIDLLGTMRVYAGDREVVITSARDRLLLAMLLLHLGQPTPTARLAEAVWGERLPRDARNQVQGCVSRLRRQLTVAGIQRPIISTEAPGYRLVVDPQDVDLYKFRGLRDEARRAASSGRTAEANQHYRDAVALWRGPALADLDSALVRDLSGPLDEERIQAISECIEIEIARGKAGELIPELTELVRQYPYQERLHGALMLAFYRAGRPAEALATYRDVHRRLRDELGVELGNDLQRLHHAILNRAPDLDPPQDEPSRAPTGDIREEFRATRPHMLPPDLPDFVGRENALAQLREQLAGQTGHATSVVVVTGPAGIGKTALSIHAAHMLSDHYRDGQLYVNLRGFDKDSPADTFEVLGRFLRALGVHGADRLEKLDERVELYRNLLAGRRVLVVLDNAASDEQVAPLIPGGHSCGVIANSRTRLGVAFGAASIGLGVFDLTFIRLVRT